MSTRQEAFQNTVDSSVRRLAGVTLSRIAERFGIQDVPQPVPTAGVNIANLSRAPVGLASLLGKYDDDSVWEEFPRFLEQYRHEIDEMTRD